MGDYTLATANKKADSLESAFLLFLESQERRTLTLVKRRRRRRDYLLPFIFHYRPNPYRFALRQTYFKPTQI